MSSKKEIIPSFSFVDRAFLPQNYKVPLLSETLLPPLEEEKDETALNFLKFAFISKPTGNSYLNIKEFNSGNKTKYIKLPYISGHVDKKTYDQCINIYDNNSVYYEEHIDKKGINELEQWLMLIIPPLISSEEIENEQFKLTNGYTVHFNTSFKDLLDIMPYEILVKLATLLGIKMK
jgi:hypothetical protein